jgi:predicted MFS family arabinose efflux permease
MGAATFAGGALTGILYDYSIPTLIITVTAIQAGALALLWATRRP